jgi:hypothetical protein
MKRFLAVLLAAVFFIALAPFAPTIAQETESGGKCGVEREAVKTLVDVDASSVNFTPRSDTVDNLRALPVPAGYDRNSERRYEPEKHTVRVRALLVGWKFEADKDFHIVIADPTDGKTMIAEPPDATCSASPHAAQFSAVRQALVACFGQPPKRFTKFPGKMVADLDGVVYLDPIHGQTGVAPNGIELHPLIRIKTVSGTCPK